MQQVEPAGNQTSADPSCSQRQGRLQDTTHVGMLLQAGSSWALLRLVLTLQIQLCSCEHQAACNATGWVHESPDDNLT